MTAFVRAADVKDASALSEFDFVSKLVGHYIAAGGVMDDGLRVL